MLWTLDNAIVIDDAGHVVLCDECPCDGGTAPECCDGTIPLTLTATWQNDGASISITYNESTGLWEGSGTANCGPSFDVEAKCIVIDGVSVWWIDIGIGFTQQYQSTDPDFVCDPFSAMSDPAPAGTCLDGDVLEFSEP